MAAACCCRPGFAAGVSEGRRRGAGQGTLKAFCEEKIATAADADAANEWQFMNILFESDARRRLMKHIGFSAVRPPPPPAPPRRCALPPPALALFAYLANVILIIWMDG